MARSLYIENCEYSVKYECPLKWKNLKKTDDPTIRFCNECNKNVYQCKNENDMDEHIKLNHCIALEEHMVMGYIDFENTSDKNRVCKHCLEPPMYCTCIEEIIKEHENK
mgnify:CR=1 FL=1